MRTLAAGFWAMGVVLSAGLVLAGEPVDWSKAFERRTNDYDWAKVANRTTAPPSGPVDWSKAFGKAKASLPQPQAPAAAKPEPLEKPRLKAPTPARSLPEETLQEPTPARPVPPETPKPVLVPTEPAPAPPSAPTPAPAPAPKPEPLPPVTATRHLDALASAPAPEPAPVRAAVPAPAEVKLPAPEASVARLPEPQPAPEPMPVPAAPPAAEPAKVARLPLPEPAAPAPAPAEPEPKPRAAAPEPAPQPEPVAPAVAEKAAAPPKPAPAPAPAVAAASVPEPAPVPAPVKPAVKPKAGPAAKAPAQVAAVERPKPGPLFPSTGYSDRQVAHFLDVALPAPVDEDGKAESRPRMLTRWQGEVRCRVAGRNADRVEALAREAMAEVAAALEGRGLVVREAEPANLLVFVLPAGPGDAPGYVQNSYDAAAIAGSKVVVYADKAGRGAVLRLLLAALGLDGQAPAGAESVFASDSRGGDRLSALDRTALELLYSPVLAPGMDQASARQAARSLRKGTP